MNFRRLHDFSSRFLRMLGGAVYEIQDSIQENAIDLVLLSTHGRSGLKHLLMGSVTEQVVRYSPCSVMTVCPSKQEILRFP